MNSIRVGIGGWTFPPWRNGTFYPKELPQTRELYHASRQVTAIEVNGTFYGMQKPVTFRRWRDETPEDFVFSLKAPRFATHRKKVGEASTSVEKFLASGFTELGPKLGPVLWQFPPMVDYLHDEFAGFLELLPDSIDGTPVRHVFEVRSESFRDPRFAEQLKARKVALAITDTEKYPRFETLTTDLAYARLQAARADVPTGYTAKALDGWAEKARQWAKAGPCYVFMINGHKEHAPAAAMALLERLR